jgi:hypothetical protein
MANVVTTTPIPVPRVPVVDLKTGFPTIPWYQYWLQPAFQSVSFDGVIGVTSGGTGLSSGIPGGVLTFIGENTLASSGTLAQFQLVIGGGIDGTPSTPLGVGTSTQVLHGNASGIPSWGPVNLATDIIGSIGVLQGGTGISSGISGGIPGFVNMEQMASSVLLTQHALIVGGGVGATPTPLASLGTANSVLHGNASGDPTYSGVDLTADVINVLPIANGGTGQTTGNAAFNALSPMTTDGDTITRSGGVAVRIPKGANGTVYTMVAGLPAWAAAGASSLDLATVWAYT